MRRAMLSAENELMARGIIVREEEIEGNSSSGGSSKQYRYSGK